jgi:hypothetical protein
MVRFRGIPKIEESRDSSTKNLKELCAASKRAAGSEPIHDNPINSQNVRFVIMYRTFSDGGRFP